MADVAVAESEIHGLGAFAIRDFKEGETVLTIDDSRVVDDEQPLRPKLGEHERYCDTLATGRLILMQPPERYINSSCEPNTYVKTIDGIRHVLARRAIRSGEEIAYDYIINCHGREVWEYTCGSDRCRGTIPPASLTYP